MIRRTAPRLESGEEEVLLSALLDDELAPSERAAALELLSVRPEAHAWLAAARRLGEIGREIWEGLAESHAFAGVADAVADPPAPFAARAAPRMNGVFSSLRRQAREDPSET
jgi:anti-sigma factor RsiW